MVAARPGRRPRAVHRRPGAPVRGDDPRGRRRTGPTRGVLDPAKGGRTGWLYDQDPRSRRRLGGRLHQELEGTEPRPPETHGVGSSRARSQRDDQQAARAFQHQKTATDEVLHRQDHRRGHTRHEHIRQRHGQCVLLRARGNTGTAQSQPLANYCGDLASERVVFALIDRQGLHQVATRADLGTKGPIRWTTRGGA